MAITIVVVSGHPLTIEALGLFNHSLNNPWGSLENVQPIGRSEIPRVIVRGVPVGGFLRYHLPDHLARAKSCEVYVAHLLFDLSPRLHYRNLLDDGDASVVVKISNLFCREDTWVGNRISGDAVGQWSRGNASGVRGNSYSVPIHALHMKI